MPPRQRFAVLAVTATNHAHQRNVPAEAMTHHASITCRHTFVCQLQIAERVIFVHIDPGVVQHEVRLIERQ